MAVAAPDSHGTLQVAGSARLREESTTPRWRSGIGITRVVRERSERTGGRLQAETRRASVRKGAAPARASRPTCAEEPRTNGRRAASAASAPASAGSCGPRLSATRSCVTENASPAARAAPKALEDTRPVAARSTRTRGTATASGARSLAVAAPSCHSGRPVACPSAAIGRPTAANATGTVLARRQRPAAGSAGKPSPTRIPAEIATGAPNPADPSSSAPKPNAIRSACSARSDVARESASLSLPKLPVAEATSCRKTAATTIAPIGTRP